MGYRIIGRSQYGIEEIDTAETLSDARYLANEYRIAFGPDWQITIKKGR